jgi:tetrapyrrole methylase family protein/MazG family protein
VVAVGLGPAGPELITTATRTAIDRARHRYLRTARHPAAVAVGDCRSFDDLYDSIGSFEDVYAGIVDALVEAATANGEVLYAVPGSPLVSERTVQLLRDDPRIELEVLPGPSFLDLAWDRLAIDPLDSSVRLVDGPSFRVQAAAERGPLLVAQCWSGQVLSEIKLAVDHPPEARVTVLQRLGLADEAVFDVDWADLDRSVDADHLTTLYVPQLAEPVAADLVRLEELVRTLRRRCPWDREQTHASLTRHLLEETYEVLEAIEALDSGPAAYHHLEEELGDLLFQVYFHSVLAAEAGQFGLADVARGVHDKLVRRHPHVFGTVEAETPDVVMANWEQIKKLEKGRESVMDGIPAALPSLLHAHKVQRKAATLGFDWPSSDATRLAAQEDLAALADPAQEHTAGPGGRPQHTAGPGGRPQHTAGPGGRPEDEERLGDLLFAVVGLARHLGQDPESSLRGATLRFRHGVLASERLAAGRGIDLSRLDAAGHRSLWDEAARSGADGSDRA